MTVGAVAAAAGLAAPADAGCRNVWAPSPEGGQLILICDGNTGNSGGSTGGGGGHKPKKKKDAYGAISLNPVPDGTNYSGATTAGYKSRSKAKDRALKACEGKCKIMATVENGWAVLVAAGGPGGKPRFFSATSKRRQRAQRKAEQRARKRLGDGGTSPVELVIGVDSRPRTRNG